LEYYITTRRSFAVQYYNFRHTSNSQIKANQAFDYEKLLLQFEDPVELRKIDFKKHPVFGFLFSRTSPKNMKELEAILKDDLTEFIIE
jgi:hypothetical protein